MRRQLARRAASENRTNEILRRSREVNDLGEQVEIALRTRDATIQRTERRAGELLSRLTRDYGLQMERALERCGGEVSRTEGNRLRRQFEREDPAPMS
ncbi:hypothetical protein NSZ01_00360 [Nocardioides szechwanensis]|nr:hypothetical protein NSZ01_00360 [Nocardioides szechwanensis]